MQKLIRSITTVFALLFILYSVIFAFTVNRFVSDTVNEEVQNTLVNVVSTIRPSFRSLEVTDITDNTLEFRSVKRTIQPMINLNDRILIYDANGNRVYTVGNEQLSNDLAFRNYEDNMDNRFRQEETEKNTIIYSYSERISNSKGDVLGYIQVLRNFPLNRPVEENIIFIAVVMALGAVILLVGFFVHFNRRIHLPILAINRQLNHIANNDYATKYTPVDIEEFDEIGENINDLSNELALQEFQITNQTQRMNKLVDAMMLGVVMVDKDHIVRLANPAIYEILGLEEQIEGRRFHLSYEEMDAYFDTETNEELTNPNDSEQIILLIYDITSIRHLEKVRSDFISNASHELKTPVTALQGFTETLLDGAIEDHDTAVEFVKIMQKESNRLGSLIKDILDLAKIEQDQIQHTSELLEADELVEDVFQHLRGRAQDKHIDLVKDDGSQLDVSFRGDRGRILQVLTNLIHNAIIYNNPYGFVKVFISEEENMIQFKISDNGIGIPQEDLPRIFERFYRVSKDRSTASGGTGLGLSIVRNILEHMGGRIEVDSVFGRGTSFTVYIPKLEPLELDEEDEIEEE